jgi:predicted nucleic acid-binding protein
MDAALLDTDALNEVLKQKNAIVVRQAATYLKQHGQFAISAMTRYEVLRGLKEKQATAQLKRFELFCQNTLVLPISDLVLDRATELWVAARQTGNPCRDADLIIAATALDAQRVLVTGNTKDFSWISNLTLIDWRLT